MRFAKGPEGADERNFIRAVVWACEGDDEGRTRSLASHLAFHLRVQLPKGTALTVETLLNHDAVENTLATHAKLESGSASTRSSALRGIMRAVAPAHLWPRITSTGSEPTLVAPYSPAEIRRFLDLALAQPSTLAGNRFYAMTVMGAGAGIIGDAFCQMTGDDIYLAEASVLASVSGPRERLVPVRADLEREALRVAASFGPDRLLSTNGRNAVTNLTHKLVWPHGVERVSAFRLRSTWLTWCLPTVPIPMLLAAAGRGLSSDMDSLVAYLDAYDDLNYQAILRGSTAPLPRPGAGIRNGGAR